MKQVVDYKYNKECGYYDIIIHKHIIHDIVLNCLQLGNEFTVTDIVTQWHKQWSKAQGKAKEYWPPKRNHIERALDDLVGIKLTKEYVSTRKLNGSITESKYKLN